MEEKINELNIDGENLANKLSKDSPNYYEFLDDFNKFAETIRKVAREIDEQI